MHLKKEYHQEYIDLDSWKPLSDFLQTHPQFHENQMRWLLRHRKQNGLENAIRKIGRSLYVHEGIFADWIHEILTILVFTFNSMA